jgi:hypothetical protein
MSEFCCRELSFAESPEKIEFCGSQYRAALPEVRHPDASGRRSQLSPACDIAASSIRFLRYGNATFM